MPYPRENILRKSATGEANKAVVVQTAAPGENMRWKLLLVLWSYSATPTGGLITIEDGAETGGGADGNYEIAVASAGPGEQQAGWQGAPNHVIKVTLAAGGASVVGHLAIVYTID